MGEYYDWVNVDKREYICPNDFNYGNKLHETTWPGNEFLLALRELLSNEWAGDHVFFMGDEVSIPEDAENETLRIIYRHTLETTKPGDPYEAVIENYRNVSCLFHAAEAEVRREILFYLEGLESGVPNLHNEYGIDPLSPFEGLFLRNGRDFPFTVNHTKKVCYSLEKTEIISFDNERLDHSDPLPLLMCYGRVTDPGAWLGDIIGVAEEVPAGYELLEKICIDW